MSEVVLLPNKSQLANDVWQAAKTLEQAVLNASNAGLLIEIDLNRSYKNKIKHGLQLDIGIYTAINKQDGNK